MQVSDTRRNQHRPAARTAADIDSNAVRRQQVPRKNAEIIVENLLPLLWRQVIRILPERRPFAAESARDLWIEVIVGASLHVCSPRRPCRGGRRLNLRPR